MPTRVRGAAVGLIAGVAWLASAAPAHAVACEDVFSKVRQPDPRAPLVVGDSVTVPAGDFLGEEGFAVDAVACRTFAQGLQVMSRRRLPELVVMALGSNAEVSRAELERALEMVGPFARLVLVLPNKLGGGPDRDGRVMRIFESEHPDQVSTLDWPAHSAGRRAWLAPDGLHLTTVGGRAFAEFIAQSVELEPVERVKPPDERRRPAPRARRERQPADPPGSRAMAELWRMIGRAVASVVAPGIRLIGRVLPIDELARQDL